MRPFLPSFLLGLVLVLGAPAASAADLTLFYLATPDCPYCRQWEAQSRGPLLASPEGRAVRFVEVRGETLRAPIEARHYPPAHRWGFDLIGPSRGVPRFVLVSNGRIIANAYGLTAYEHTFLPVLRAAAAGSQSSAGKRTPRRHA